MGKIRVIFALTRLFSLPAGIFVDRLPLNLYNMDNNKNILERYIVFHKSVTLKIFLVVSVQLFVF